MSVYNSSKITLKENVLKYETYVELRESVGWKNFSEEQTRKAIDKSYYNLVAFVEGKPVGMARVVGDGMYLTIVDVIVIPENQGRGYGKAMMEMILKYIEEKTPIGSRVSIQLIAEKGKESFYEKMGFKCIPHEHCGSGMRKVFYKNDAPVN